MANVLLPSLVKLHFPDRIGTVTALYTTALAIGLTAALMLTVPIADAFGGWRAGLGAWAVLGVRSRRSPGSAWPATTADLEPSRARTASGSATSPAPGSAGRWRCSSGCSRCRRTPIFGWFAQLWRDAGYCATAAGILVGIVAATSHPAVAVAADGGRPAERPARVLLAVMLLLPDRLPRADGRAVRPGRPVGGGHRRRDGTFPLILTLIGLRAPTPEGTAALSGFTQSTGYLLAAVGPFAVGLLHDASGGWTVPLLALTVLVVPMVALGTYVARPAAVEQQLKSAGH